MCKDFVVTSSQGDTQLIFSGVIPRGLVGYDEVKFTVTLKSSHLSAILEVYDIQPQRWAEYFRDIPDNWRGWSGTKEHCSLEGQLRLSCTCDALGHYFLRLGLRGDMTGADWIAEDTIYLEAGQLDAIARAAKAYFG